MGKKAAKDVLDITKTGFTMGAGASIGTKLGGTAGADTAKAISGMSGQLPTLGTITGAGMVLRPLKKLYPKKRR